MTAVEAGPGPGPMAAELQRRYPGSSVWGGAFTRRWWALVRDGAGRDRLVEATSTAELARRLDELDARPVTSVHVPRYPCDRLASTSMPSRPPSARHRRPVERGRLRGAFAALVRSLGRHRRRPPAAAPVP